MMKKYTEEQLNNPDRDILIVLFMGLQEQMNRTLDLMSEQNAVMNQRRFGRSSEKAVVVTDDRQGYLAEIGGELTVVFNETESLADGTFAKPEETEVFQEKKKTTRPKG